MSGPSRRSPALHPTGFFARGTAALPTPGSGISPTTPAPPGFLGRGWAFPPSFDRFSGSVAMASGEVDIRQALWIILSTSLGERVMLAGFGCDLRSMVFVGLPTTAVNELAAMVPRAIREWEPRVTVDSVTVTESQGGVGWLDISIDYLVRRTNARSNLVYPFYMQEATIPWAVG